MEYDNYRKPYASEFLIDTIVQNDWGVLDNTAVEEADIEEGAFDLISSDIAKLLFDSGISAYIFKL